MDFFFWNHHLVIPQKFVSRLAIGWVKSSSRQSRLWSIHSSFGVRMFRFATVRGWKTLKKHLNGGEEWWSTMVKNVKNLIKQIKGLFLLPFFQNDSRFFDGDNRWCFPSNFFGFQSLSTNIVPSHLQVRCYRPPPQYINTFSRAQVAFGWNQKPQTDSRKFMLEGWLWQEKQGLSKYGYLCW